MSIEDEKASSEATGQAPYLGQTIRDIEERIGPRIEEAREQLDQVNTRIKGFIRQNPGTSLLCAVGVGYLIGKLASRR